MRQAGLIGLVFALCAAAITPLDRAAAQVTAPQVTAEQQNAIRTRCRSDFMAKCSGVTPGGKNALMCLQKNVASLTPACKTAVSATIPAPAPAVVSKPAPAVTAAPAPSPPAEPAAATATATATALPPPAPRLGQSTVVSAPPPRASLPTRTLAPKTPKAAPAQPAPAPPPQQAVVAPPPATTKRPNAPIVMTAVIGRACLRDLALHCRSTGAGDGQKIACLTARGERLAPLCKAALKITER